MKSIRQHILEKLKVSSKGTSSDITLGKLIDAFRRFENRNDYKEVDLKTILTEYPTVLEYNGTNTKKKIIGQDILRLGCMYDRIDLHKYIIYMYVKLRIGSLINEIRVDIENTEALYEIFGKDVLNEIYDYLEQYEKD